MEAVSFQFSLAFPCYHNMPCNKVLNDTSLLTVKLQIDLLLSKHSQVNPVNSNLFIVLCLIATLSTVASSKYLEGLILAFGCISKVVLAWL